MSESAEQTIRRIIAGQTISWNAGDGPGYARPFTEDGSFTNVLGTTLVGRALYEQRHVEIFAGFFRGTTLASHIERVRFVAPTVALVDIEAVVAGVHDAPPAMPLSQGVLRTHLLQVFVANDSGWQIAAHHNVAVIPRPHAP